ncbi:MAG: hypothetical protein NWE87_06790, partial [Candidatus Bathyarchaeota archaeon]|nr:hypothetical protein [Candidatus Bathyarchaeota archaeon]
MWTFASWFLDAGFCHPYEVALMTFVLANDLTSYVKGALIHVMAAFCQPKMVSTDEYGSVRLLTGSRSQTS